MSVNTLLLKTFCCTRDRALLIFLLLSIALSLNAQIGLHPPSVDYQQLVTPNVRIIFPKGYENRANRVASMVDELRTNHTSSIGEKHFMFDLVLQTPNTEVNGYVGLGPFVSEFYVTPPQQMNLLSGSDWVDLLTIHEFRHVQQNSNERRGITKLFSYLQGQYGWAVLSGIATPNWFSEGDAVVYETALTRQGRGRTPAFSNTLRSLLANNVEYSYAKARNGSFRSLVPDHYRYGYGILTYARERFGGDVWRSVLHDGASYKGLIYPFSKALKKKTGYSTKELYEVTMADLAARQDSARAARPALVEGLPFGFADKSIVNYRFPTVDAKARVLALRSGYDVTPALVAVSPTGAKDQVLTSVGIQREPYLFVRDDLAVWMENRQHPRYTNLRYSDIVLYELDSGRKRQLTEKGKFFSPALSFDRRRIVAVEHDPLNGPPTIVVLETSTGEVLASYPQQTQGISFPRFSPHGEKIYFYDRSYNGIAIKALNLETKEVTTVRERKAESLDYLKVTPEGKLLFTSGRDGINNVYQFNGFNGITNQLTNVSIGAQWPHLSQAGNLYYSEATPLGLRLRRMDLSGEKNVSGWYAGLPGGMLPTGPSVFERPAAFAGEVYDLPAKVKTKTYPTSNFSDNLGGIQLHSWSFNGSYLAPGVTVQARNALNTIRFEANTDYNINEERTTTGISIDYGGFYPVVGLDFNTRGRAYAALQPRTDTVLFNVFRFDQLRAGISASIPWQWVNGDYRTELVPGISYTWNKLTNKEEDLLPNTFGELGVRLRGSVLRRRAFRQVQSRFGASFSLVYDQGLGEDIGNRFLLRSSVFLPGFSQTHGLRLDADFQAEDSGNNYQFPDGFFYARGYGAVLSDQISRLGVNYQLPVAYPDFGIAGITYFKRIRLNAFYDYSRRTIDQFDFVQSLSSVGGQVFFDNRWLNAQDITVGVEVAYLLDAAKVGIGQQAQFRFLVSGGF
ncbi:MAG: TolB family protein [Lewinella sp.]